MESETVVESRSSLGPLRKRESHEQVYSQGTPQRSNPFKVSEDKTTSHKNEGFFQTVEKEKQTQAKKAAEKSRKSLSSYAY